MVVVTYTLDIGDEKALDSFDDVTLMAFGNNNTTPSETQTGLINEIVRVSATDITKDTTGKTYSFTGRVPITEFNSETVYEIGLFSSSGTMAARLVLTTGLTKTDDEELIFVVKIKVNTKNT